MNVTGYIWRADVIDKLAWKHQIQVEEIVADMGENRSARDPLPDTFETIEEMAEFWDIHDITD